MWPEDQLERMGKAVPSQEEVEDQTSMAMERIEQMDCETKQKEEKSNESIYEENDDSDNSLSSGSDSDSDSDSQQSDSDHSESKMET